MWRVEGMVFEGGGCFCVITSLGWGGGRFLHVQDWKGFSVPSVKLRGLGMF